MVISKEEALLDAFTNSDNGQKIWDEARERYPAYNWGNYDTIEASIFILEHMDVPNTYDSDLIVQMIFEGLT